MIKYNKVLNITNKKEKITLTNILEEYINLELISNKIKNKIPYKKDTPKE